VKNIINIQTLLMIFSLFLLGGNKEIFSSMMTQNSLNFVLNFKKIAYATRIHNSPSIDGILSEKIWDITAPINSFVQDYPNNLHAPTEKTEVKLLFNNDALYVGVRLFDSEPSKISERLARRDDWMAGFEGIADWFTIELDTRFDHQTAFMFAVNASGIQVDATIFDDSDYDEEWNAVWQSAVSRNMDGWSIEIEIPFSILRYTEVDSMVWGMDMARYIHRKNEHITWIPHPRGAKGIVSRYGRLKGLDHIPVSKQIEILPYVLSGGYVLNGEELSFPDTEPLIFTPIQEVDGNIDGGVDIKYGIGSNSTIDLTINPDFGWIEADPANINLTYYETYYEEKRPFFMENSMIFDTPIEMFYSRRIGKMESRILSAGKLSGKSSEGLTYCILGALTSNHQGGSWKNDWTDTRLNYYLTSRIVQDVMMGNSYIGLMLTFAQLDAYSAHTISADHFFSFGNNRLIIDEQIAISDVEGNSGIGYVGEVVYDNESFLDTYLSVDYFDQNFNNNDLGFLRRNDLMSLNTGFTLRMQEPGLIARYMYAGIDVNHQTNLDGLIIGNLISLDGGITFNNYWRIAAGVNRSLGHFDDRLTYDYETKNLGPPAKIPQTDGVYFSISSDRTLPIQISSTAGKGWSTIGDSGRQFSTLFSFRPTSAIETSLNFSRNRSFEKFHWLETVSEEISSNGFTDSVVHFMFAESNNRIDILTLRISAGLAMNKSIEFYSEYFQSINRFNDDHYSELLETNPYPVQTGYQPYSDSPDDYTLLDPNLYSEFYTKFSSLNLNFVFRWEYAAGSTLFLIYSASKSINGKEMSSISDFWKFDGGVDWSEFAKESSIYMKLNYRFNRF